MFNTIVFSNGLKVVYEIIPFVKSISCGIWVGNGSRNETISTGGISHFIEHMLFKGTSTRTAKDIADQMDAIGGQMNAFTSKEYTCYYTRTLENHFDIAIDILADMFFNSNFDQKEIEKECNVILEEIDMYEDTPEDLVHDILQHNIFPESSLGRSILGTANSIKSFDKKSFKEYYNKHYHQENTIISIAGNFSEKELLAKIEKYFGNFKRQEAYNLELIKPKFNPCFISKEKDIEQLHLCLAFESLEIGHKYSYELTILNTILGGGMSSRLFQKIREEHGLAYSIYSFNSSYTDTGVFSIYAGLNKNQINQVISLIISEIKNLFKNKITDEQLIKAKEQLKSSYLLSLESSSNRMNSIGKSKLLLDRILTPSEFIEKVDLVDLEKIYKLASDIFNFEKCALSAVGNTKNINFERILKNAI